MRDYYFYALSTFIGKSALWGKSEKYNFHELGAAAITKKEDFGDQNVFDIVALNIRSIHQSQSLYSDKHVKQDISVG
jgi:hypothetical protein